MPVVFGVKAPRKATMADVRLLAVRQGETFEVFVLGPLVGLQTHWNGKKSVPCLGAEDCRFHDCPFTWKGYQPVAVPGWSIQGKKPGVHLWVLVASEEVGHILEGSNRGDRFCVSRRSGPCNAPMRVEFKGREKPELLPQTFDVKPYVLRASGFFNS